jgi:2-C-methyl-D-erythritol 2,4-cyclodiphosphate synthase
MIRIGQGWDRHRLEPGRPCRLGGVDFPEAVSGPVGHSDGDVVCHAVIDAVLGAAGLEDIGTLFPDTDPQWAGAAGLDLLARAWSRVSAAGWRLGNLDLTIIAEHPLIGPRRPDLVRNLAQALGVAEANVAVKATRGEGLGPEGRGEGITVQAVALLERS